MNEHRELLRTSGRVLEIAPGPYSRRLFGRLPHVTFVTLDLSSALARVRGDLAALPFGESSFDLIICLHVLEHVDDDRAALRELRRVLNQRGTLLVQVPIEREVTFEDASVKDPEQRLAVFGQDDHVRSYGLDFLDRLRAAGFAVQADDLGVSLSDQAIRRYGLIRDESIYVAQVDQGSSATS